MRCAQCGIPLSPSRSSCPRCGTPTGNTSRKGSVPPKTIPQEQGAFQNQEQHDTNMGTPQTWGSHTPANGWNEQSSVDPATVPQLPFEQPAQVFGTLAYNTYNPVPAPGDQQPLHQPPTTGPNPFPPVPGYEPPLTPQSFQIGQMGIVNPQAGRKRKTTLGFTVAGLCITAGALLMIFVFVMAQSLPPDTTTSPRLIQTTTTAQTPVQSTLTPTVSPTQTASPAASLAGQQYIDNAHLASAVSPTGQIITETSNFRVGGAVNIVVTIHQTAYKGAVCFKWYLNNQFYGHYETSASPQTNINAPETTAFAYINPPVPGKGYVEISWASTTACTDAVLAQRADFTVS